MIFPFFSSKLSLFRNPVTWGLILINLAVYLITAVESSNAQAKLERLIQDRTFSETQGLVFARHIEKNKERYPSNLQYLASESLTAKDKPKTFLLGGLAMRDAYFLNSVENLNLPGDQILHNWWKQKFNDFKETRDAHPSYRLGVTNTNNDVWHWISYQFSHSGLSHFLGNMIFLLIFASQLELVLGSVTLFFVYLLTGVFAALTFLYFNEVSAIPLIGASGAVSGLMALFSVLYWNKGVKFIFFLFVPKRGYSGFVYLPAGLILVMWSLADFAGHWASPPELGGIAYSVHLGGEFFGALLGVLLLFFNRYLLAGRLIKTDAIETRPFFTTVT